MAYAAGMESDSFMTGGIAPVGIQDTMTTKVELSISCRNLCDTDTFSLSDPIVVMSVQDGRTKIWIEEGRTEIIWNNLNPVFAKKFVLDYHFEEIQRLKFDVYDVDSKSPDLSKHDYLGGIEVNLGEIVSSGTLQKSLVGGPRRNKGSIIFRSEELHQSQDEITMEFIAKKVDRKDVFGLSDPFLAFYRINEDCSKTLVYKTRPIKNTLNPSWPRFTIKVQLICNGDKDRSLIIECYDWNKNGRHELIGECSSTVRELSEWPNGISTFPLINQKKKQKSKKYKDSGTLQLVYCSVEEVPSFLDYIQGGTELNCTISIDFTASNGDPNKPGTLHYMTPYQPTQYTIALQAVGEIIQDYDSDNMFPALGFGAKIPPQGTVSHCFPLNGNLNNPFCHGIEGVVAAYQQTIRSVSLYGPTNFAPTIIHAASMARQHLSGDQYFILLILTDGIITDMPQTREAIVKNSDLPLSIIIVGIGDAEFDAMDELDGDEVRLTSNGVAAERDIVQFVPFRDYIRQGSSAVAQHLLRKAVLEEIPGQLVSFMLSKGIKPGQRFGRVNRSLTNDQVFPSMPSSVNSSFHTGDNYEASRRSSRVSQPPPNEPPPPYF